jgi:hypothetical protein
MTDIAKANRQMIRGRPAVPEQPAPTLPRSPVSIAPRTGTASYAYDQIDQARTELEHSN